VINIIIKERQLINRIEIKRLNKFPLPDSINLKDTIYEDLNLRVDNITIVNIYLINGNYTDNEIEKLQKTLFCDPVSEESRVGFSYATIVDYDYGIEISYKLGVTDNIGKTAAEGIGYILNREIDPNSVRSAKMYLFKTSLQLKDIERIATEILCNSLIEDYFIFSKKDALNGRQPVYNFNFNEEKIKEYYKEINLEVSDEKLIEISEKGILSLSLEEMKAIKKYYEREDVIKKRKEKKLPLCPTDVELEIFAQTWSEHCKHKIFNAIIEYKEGEKIEKIDSLFKTYIQKSAEIIKKNRDDLFSLFKDNSGVVKFNDNYAYCMKVETHNSPSALDPYGGAMTGIVGVNRDILGTGLGAYPIFNTDVFCFGDPFISKEQIPEGVLHPKRIFRGVHRGIKDGGNESGIPTVNGSITFDNSFLGKPLVFCGTGGIMLININNKKCYKKYVKPGDLIVMTGGRIGKDGIHGATFSSLHLTEDSPTSAVQIGDPITQKKMVDFIIEARDKDLFSGLTDNGAGGLSSSVGEMATFTNGAILYLEKCPLKYKGLKPWEILLSEAQERMTIAVPKEKIDEFIALSKLRDVESTVIGEFTDSGYFECKYNDQIIAFIDLDMLHNGVPKMNLKAEWEIPKESIIKISENDIGKALKDLLKRPNIASKEYWVRMYDHEVGARTVGKPFSGKNNEGPSDGAVLKIFPDSYEGLVVTHGIMPRYSLIDSYQMAANAIDEAFRQAIILGADPDKIVGLDNFCWPDPVESPTTPDGKFKLAQLVRACKAIYEITPIYNCPCISGKDSMKNDYRRGDKKISVLPTLLFTAIGKINDIRKSVSFYFKKENSLIFLIGETRKELGASEYYQMKGIAGGSVPKVYSEKAIKTYKKINKLIENSILLSAHDLSDGGLIVALAEASFSGNLGVDINLNEFTDLSIEEILFSETPSRILVSIAEKDRDKFLEIMNGESIYYLGKTTNSDQLVLNYKNKVIMKENIYKLKDIWKNALIF